MKGKRLPASLLAAALVLSGCGDNPARALDALGRDVDAYIAAPSEEKARKVEAGIEDVNRQIAEMAAKNSSGVPELSRKRDACVARYAGARAGSELRALRDAAKGVGESIKEAGRAFGEALRGETNSR